MDPWDCTAEVQTLILDKMKCRGKQQEELKHFTTKFPQTMRILASKILHTDNLNHPILGASFNASSQECQRDAKFRSALYLFSKISEISRTLALCSARSTIAMPFCTSRLSEMGSLRFGGIPTEHDRPRGGAQRVARSCKDRATHNTWAKYIRDLQSDQTRSVPESFMHCIPKSWNGKR